MIKIQLVNMPFSALHIPSIALTQLRSVVEAAMPGRTSVDVHYLNHAFGTLFGIETYGFIANSMEGHVSGFGEWLFRRSAFPDLPDNSDAFFARYAQHFGPERLALYGRVIEPVRARLDDILDELIDQHGLDQADLVGLTSMFFQNLPSFALARRLKLRNPNQIVVMGGANCEGTMGIEIINHVPSLDFVFSGHGLLSFPEFVEHLASGNVDAMHRIDGVLSRQNSRSIEVAVPEDEVVVYGKHSPKRQLDGIAEMGRELDIQTPVALDYDGFLESYVGRFPEVADRVELLFETSRGCWWGERAHCTFCGLNGGTMSYRAMAPDAAITMIEGLFDRYADRVHRFASVDNILPREYVDGVFARLKTPPHVVMFYEVKADLSEDDLRILAKAGVRELQPGIEALATSTLKLMRKGTTSFNNLKFLSLCMQYDVTPMWNLLVGFPGESADTYRTYLEDLPHLAHLPPPQGVFPVRFDRFSPYFTEAVRYELKLAPLDYYALSYPFPPRVLMNMAYYFADQNADAPYAVAVGSWIAPLREAVGQWQRRWHTQDGLFAPSLTLIESEYGTTLEDTRRGMMIETDLGDGELACLAALAEPREEDAMQAEFGAAYDLLVRKNLVFRERGRVMSLVPTGDSGVAVSRALAS